MQTTRIVLTEPFVKHPAGLVFDLPEATGIAGWDDDERVRDRQSFIGKRTYTLPDGGNGISYDLPQSSTKDCPPGIFDQVDLRSGPCRITRAAFQREGAGNDQYNPGFNLIEINGLAAQGFEFAVNVLSAVSIDLYDRLEDLPLRSLDIKNSFDGHDLNPGFYEISIRFQTGDPYCIRFIKSFPLLVIFEGRNGPYSLVETRY